MGSRRRREEGRKRWRESKMEGNQEKTKRWQQQEEGEEAEREKKKSADEA
jgi:hypothetical protein